MKNILMKKIGVVFILLSGLFTQVLLASPMLGKQWFIQVGAYQSLDNAIKAKKNYEDKLTTLSLYGVERQYNNYLTIFQRKGFYSVLMGPYPNQKDTIAIQKVLPNYKQSTFLIHLQKYSYEDYKHGYRFTLSPVTEADYVKAVTDNNLLKEGLKTFTPYQFIKSSPDKTHRFVKKGDEYGIEVKQEDQWSYYSLESIFKADQDVPVIKLEDLYWSTDNVLYLYDYANTKHQTYDNVFTLAVENGQVTRNSSKGVKFAKVKHQAVLSTEQIKVIDDFNEAQAALKPAVTFSLEESAQIKGINCANSKSISFPMVVNFIAFFPDEHIIVAKGEGETYINISTLSCSVVKKSPYLIRYNPDRSMRIYGESLDPLGNDKFFIESWDNTQKHAVELLDIGIFFAYYLNTALTHIVWSGNSELFIVKTHDDANEYYKLSITPLK